MDSRPVEVPVSAHIKKFCDSFFGNPIRLDDTSSHRIAMKIFLSAPMQLDMFFKHEPLRILPNTIYLEITRKKYQTIQIHRQNLQQIVKYINKIFEEELDEYVQAHACKKSHSNGYKKHVEAFCKLHNIEILTDIGDDALTKLYYRYRETKKASKTELAEVA